VKSLLRHSVELLLFSNCWVALTVGTIVTGVAHYYRIEMHWLYGSFAFFGTFTTYNFHRLIRHKSFQQAAITTPRSRWLEHHQTTIIVCSIFSTLVSIGLLVFLPMLPTSLLLLTGTGFIVLFYPIRVPIVGKSLREFSGLKNAWIVIVWVVLVLLPIVNENQPFQWGDVSIVALLVYSQIIPFDIRDLKYDLPHMRTIPQLIGVMPARLLGTVLMLILVLLLIAQHNFHWIGLLIPFTSMIGLWWKQQPSNIHYLEFLWEGAIILLGIYFYILPCLDS